MSITARRKAAGLFCSGFVGSTLGEATSTNRSAKAFRFQDRLLAARASLETTLSLSKRFKTIKRGDSPHNKEGDQIVFACFLKSLQRMLARNRL